MSSVDIKSETDSLRPDSPKTGEALLSSKSTQTWLELVWRSLHEDFYSNTYNHSILPLSLLNFLLEMLV